MRTPFLNPKQMNDGHISLSNSYNAPYPLVSKEAIRDYWNMFDGMFFE